MTSCHAKEKLQFAQGENILGHFAWVLWAHIF